MQSEFGVWFVTQRCHPKMVVVSFFLEGPLPHFYLKSRHERNASPFLRINATILSVWHVTQFGYRLVFLRLPLILNLRIQNSGSSQNRNQG